MKKSNKLLYGSLIAGTMLCSATAMAVSAALDLEPAQLVSAPKRYIITFQDDSNGLMTANNGQQNRYSISQATLQMRMARNAERIAQVGGTIKRNLGYANAVAAEMTPRQLQQLMNTGVVASAEEDPIRYLIAPVNTAAVQPSAETTPYGITMVQADQVSDANSSNIKICIVDTGYDGNHEDLRPYTGANISGDNNDGNGNDTGNWWQPGHSHGTHVAGTIAAIGNNGLGVKGVLPSDQVGLHIVKVFNDQGNWAYGSDLIAAVDQCVAAGSKVISMSLGGSASSQAEQNAFDSAYNQGILSIAAAGNGGNTAMAYPASYDSVMSVAAIDSNKNLASFSQRNSQVEIAAPGVGINSTIIGGYASWDGTSMATPHVSGVAALVWSHFPSCTAAQMRQTMTATAEDLGSPGRDNSYGYGLVQAKAMYDAILAGGCGAGGNNGGGGGTNPPPTSTPLTNGVPETGLSGAAGDELRFTLDVPAGATNLTFDMSGGTGDADLYVRFGAEPTTNSWDCRPYTSGNNESCPINPAQTGTYYVMVKGYSSFSGVSLVGSYTEAGSGGGTGSNYYENLTDVQLADRQTRTSNISVDGTGDSGNVTISVDIKHTWRGDLRITLVAPDGSRYRLKDTNYWDSADNVLADYPLDLTGTERNGNWTLEVYDAYSGDTGFIDAWSITFN